MVSKELTLKLSLVISSRGCYTLRPDGESHGPFLDEGILMEWRNTKHEGRAIIFINLGYVINIKYKQKLQISNLLYNIINNYLL